MLIAVCCLSRKGFDTVIGLDIGLDLHLEFERIENDKGIRLRAIIRMYMVSDLDKVKGDDDDTTCWCVYIKGQRIHVKHNSLWNDQ